ncbi:siderophore-interacting protein [Acidisphaera sp. S103]|uniref:siderophore-interacting protein n=1 Tax=Acidisphaera sp. S103 TaxID=1747223 RepID=UPI00131DFFC2|nr:siderophore-interacting protein [Acidisphaera sp. S103]
MSQHVATAPRHHILRIRRETRRRLVSVTATERITPNMLRIRFASPDLHDFESLAPDDHVKLFVPNPLGDEPCRRDYTPRAFDADRGLLTIDFALHEAGPATAWALAVRLGDRIEIGGPRGSILVADDFDWYLLIGDETALPAIGRWVESRRAGVPVKTIVVVGGDAERQDFATRADWDAMWVSRSGDDAALLQAAVAACGPLPQGDGYVWIAAEARVARVLRTYVGETLGHPKAWMKASGYWMMGQADAHVSLDD